MAEKRPGDMNQMSTDDLQTEIWKLDEQMNQTLAALRDQRDAYAVELDRRHRVYVAVLHFPGLTPEAAVTKLDAWERTKATPGLEKMEPSAILAAALTCGLTAADLVSTPHLLGIRATPRDPDELAAMSAEEQQLYAGINAKPQAVAQLATIKMEAELRA